VSWFDARKDGACNQCGAPVSEGERMWSVRRGYYTCEPCGFLREQASSGDGEQGAIEAGVIESLKAYPPEAMGTGIAQMMLYQARLLDRSEASARDVPTISKEIRQAQAQLELMFPPTPEDDATDAAQKRRDRKMAGLDEYND
jgi:hypothetical protein